MRPMREVLIPVRYPAPRRLPVGERARGKEATYMPSEDAVFLLRGKVLVEEKMDGRSSKFSGDGARFVVFAEDMKVRHSLKYRVPARFAVFDVFDVSKTRFLCRDGKADVFKSIRRGVVKVYGKSAGDFFLVQEVFRGRTTLEQLPGFIGLSAYAIGEDGRPAGMEGIVVKPDRELYAAEFDVGKLVRAEFQGGITANYLRQPRKFNLIDPSSDPSLWASANPVLA